MTENALKLDLSFRDEDAGLAEAVLRESGVQGLTRVDQHGMTGLEVLFVGVVGATALANITLRLVRLWKCGVMIDARGSRVLTEKNCDLPAGTVLVIATDGTRSTLHEPSEVAIQRALLSRA